MKHFFKLLTLFVIASFISFHLIIANSKSQANTNSSPSQSSSADYDKFLKDIIARVKKDYVEEKTDKQLVEAAANGILSSLDPHSSYLNEDEFKEMQVQTKGGLS